MSNNINYAIKKLLLPAIVLILTVSLAQAAEPKKKKPAAPAPVVTQASATASGAGKRVALIIGNGSYKDSPLKNPPNDAEDMVATLKSLGFEVISRKNANQQQFKSAVREFGQKLRGAETGLFYYAGHGMQVKGVNYLVPVAVDIQSEADAEDQAVSLDYVMRTMEEGGAKFNVSVLDACRNNPFARSFRSASRGLAQTQTASGMLVAYATSPGSVAADGDGRNGIYTKHLLKNLKEGDSDILKVFQRVRTGVVTETGGKQTPWETTSLVGDFYFKPGAQVATLTPEAVAPNSSLLEAVSPSTTSESSTSSIEEPEMIAIPGKNYAIGKYEVTQRQWVSVMGNNASGFTNCGDSCPVEQVSWDDVQAFIQKLNAKTGQQYRLPTEAEWEHACRAGSQQEYCGSDNVDSVAWYYGNSGSSTHPAGQKQANAWGLYDMSGNVWEWVQDCYNGDCAKQRVLRGGSWVNVPKFVHAAYRNRYVPAFRDSIGGFRLARTLP